MRGNQGSGHISSGVSISAASATVGRTLALMQHVKGRKPTMVEMIRRNFVLGAASAVVAGSARRAGAQGAAGKAAIDHLLQAGH